MGKLLSANLIAATLALVAPAYAQVRVITGDTEHAYGPGGQPLDDAEPGSGLSTGPGGGLSTGPGGPLSSGPCGGLSTGPACKLEK